MKRILLAIAFSGIFSSVLKAQTLDCKKFRDGTFKIEAQGVTTFIKRKGSKQSESIQSREGSSHFKVRWLDECTYTLTPTKKTRKTFFSELPENAVLTIKITEVKENSYIQTSTANFSDMVLSSEVIRIE